MILCNDNGNDNFKCLINKTTTLHICHLHISHNASYLPPKILHNLCFSFLLGITAVPREIENNAYAKFWGGQIRCFMGDVQVVYALHFLVNSLLSST